MNSPYEEEFLFDLFDDEGDYGFDDDDYEFYETDKRELEVMWRE